MTKVYGCSSVDQAFEVYRRLVEARVVSISEQSCVLSYVQSGLGNRTKAILQFEGSKPFFDFLAKASLYESLAELTETTSFSSKQVEWLAGASQQNQRNWRRFGYLSATKGWAKYSVIELLDIWVANGIVKKGVSPKEAFKIAKEIVPEIIDCIKKRTVPAFFVRFDKGIFVSGDSLEAILSEQNETYARFPLFLAFPIQNSLNTLAMRAWGKRIGISPKACLIDLYSECLRTQKGASC